MKTDRFAICAALVLVTSFFSSAQGATAAGLSGQWVGNSQVEGRKAIAKTTLTLGEADSDGTTLRIEDANTCTLRKGKYSADGDRRWAVSFGEASGGEGCKRLAAGTFALRRGDNPRQVYLEASYHDADGATALRHAALNRYP